MTDVVWTRSTRCETNTCVDVARTEDEVRVRQGNLGIYGPQLRFTRDEWRAFVDGVKAGQFDVDD